MPLVQSSCYGDNGELDLGRVTWPPFVSISIRERLLASFSPGFLCSSQQQILISLRGCLRGLTATVVTSGYQVIRQLTQLCVAFMVISLCGCLVPCGFRSYKDNSFTTGWSITLFKRSPVEELLNVAGSNSNGKQDIFEPLNPKRSQRTHRLACKFNLHGFSVDFDRLGRTYLWIWQQPCGGL